MTQYDRDVNLEQQHKDEITRLRAALEDERACVRAIVAAAGERREDHDIVEHVRFMRAALTEAERERDEARDQVRQWQETSAAEVAGIIALREECGAGADETFPDFVRRLAYERDAATKRAEEAEQDRAASESMGLQAMDDATGLRKALAEAKRERDRLEQHCDLYDALRETVDSELPLYTNDDGDDCDEIDRVCAAGSELRELQRERDEARNLLHSLTPGGSEFAGNPGACHDYIVRRNAETLDVVKRMKRERDAATKRAEEAEALLTSVREEIVHDAPDDCYSTGPVTDPVVDGRVSIAMAMSDYVECPMCSLWARIDAHLARAGGPDEPD